MPIPPSQLVSAIDRGAGATFYTFALQVNPWGYLEDNPKPGGGFADEETYNNALVAQLLAHGVDAIAVTDHNRIDCSRDLMTLAREAGVVVFPGFEIRSSEGVHVLALFDPGARIENVEKHLNHLVHENEPLSQLSTIDLLTRIHELGGISILPHVDNEKGGLFGQLRGDARVAVWTHDHLRAVAVTCPIERLDGGAKEIVLGRNSEYARKQPLAVLHANDVSDPSALDESPECLSRLKMTELNVDGLRHAFMDPGSRVRHMTDAADGARPEILGLHWAGGFLDGTTLTLSSGLNTVIGGRGAGKSSVLRSIRFVLGIDPLTPATRSDQDSFVREVLRPDSEVWAAVRSLDPDNRIYYVKRAVGSPPIVYTPEGEVVDVPVADIGFRVESFAQQELADVARDSSYQIALVRRYVEDETGLQRAIATSQADLVDNRGEIEECEEGIAELRDRLSALPGKREKSSRYAETDLAEKLGRKPEIERERRIIDEVIQLVAKALESEEALRADHESLNVEELAEKLGDESPTASHIRKALAAVESLGKRLLGLSDEVTSGLAKTRAEVEKTREAWKKAIDKELASLDEALRAIDAAGATEADFLRLQAEIDDLEKDDRQLKRERKKLRALLAKREALLSALRSGQENRDAEFGRAAKRAASPLTGTVRVAVVRLGILDPLESLLRDEVGGRLREAMNAFQELTRRGDLNLGPIASAVRTDSSHLKELGVPEGTAERLAEAGETLARMIEELDLPPMIEIMLRVGGPEKTSWQPLLHLSTGQKATALMLLALADSEGAGPLVIDQPENDLDTEFIVSGVVQRLREGKAKRQYLFATHNPNIPVLADSELVAALEASGEASDPTGRSRVSAHGSIDAQEVRQHVAVLDGGEEAFGIRRRRYGF